MHTTLVHVHVLPQHIDDFIAATKANHEASVREPNNRRFDVLQSVDDPTRFRAPLKIVDFVFRRGVVCEKAECTWQSAASRPRISSRQQRSIKTKDAFLEAPFVLYEAYATADDAEAHKQTAHYLEWRDTMANWMAAPRQGVTYRGLLPPG